MNERDKRARDIFEQAVEIESPEARAAFLEKDCGEEHALRAEVDSLLEAHAKATGFLEPLDEAGKIRGQVNQPNDATLDAPAIERAGAVLGGRYKLLENIGEGGMGAVWVAEQQQPVKRRVAIKLVKAGMDSKQVLARFESERQALALMDHPNIAKVFDGGMTEQGRPYFVMEYVKGVPFTDYCNRARLPLRERLTLFIPVCQAVQHAHHKGIVHRDLKPSNILICLYDGNPVPKVIDFGLAKALHQSLTDKSIYTGHGIMVGTPLYMSPEQAEHNNLDVDTRTDIYSLGVILYELLTGSTPLERQQLQKAAIDEVLRLIKEVEPQRPSIRLSGSESLPSIAAQRSIDPRELRRTLAGDLDWIVMKSLEKERSRRYETPNGLARDIERFLNDEAVEACPPSRSYRLKKFIRKHRVQVIAVSAVLLALLIGVVGTSWGLFRAVNAEQAATKSEQKTSAALVEVTKERDAKVEALLAEEKQREMAEQNLVAGILRPIGFNTELLDQSELKSLADWSALGDSRLKLLALETAFADADTSLRIARRAERVIQACVGLSPTRRAKAIELVSAKQRDMSADPRIRVAACWLALELGSSDLPALEESFQFLGEHNGRIYEYVEFVKFAVSRTDPLQSKRVTRCWDALIDILRKDMAPTLALNAAGEGLVAMAPRLDQDQVARFWNSLIEVLGTTRNLGTPKPASIALVAIVPRLEPEQVARDWDALIGMLEKYPFSGVINYAIDSQRFDAAVNHLVVLAPRLTPEQVTRAGNTLIGLLEKSTHLDVAVNPAGDGLVALAPWLTPEQVTRGGETLIGLLEKSTHSDVLHYAAIDLVLLAPRLSPEQVTRGGDALIGLLEKSTNQYRLAYAGEGLAALAPRLTQEQVTRGWDALIGVREKSTSDFAWRAAVDGLVALAPRLTSESVTRGWDTLIGVLEKSTDDYVSLAAGNGLVALAPSLTSEQVTRGWDTLIGVPEVATVHMNMSEIPDGLVALAPRLTLEHVTRSWDALIREVEKPPMRWGGIYAGEGLKALAPRLTPEEVTRGWATLIGVLEKSNHDYVLRPAVDGLVALAPRLTPEQATRSGDTLIGLFERTAYDYVLQTAVDGLVVLAPRLTLEQMIRRGDALINLLQRSTKDNALCAAGECFAKLTPMLTAEQVTRGGDALIGVLEKSTDYYYASLSTGNWLVALAPKLTDEQRLRAAEALVKSSQLRDGVILGQLRSFIPFLDVANRDRISIEAVTIMLDDVGSNGMYRGQNELGASTFFQGSCVAFSLSNSKSLAKLLSHPGCADVPREFMLQRFEELLFHNGEHVFQALPKSDAESQSSDEPKPAPPPRRFHNLHDAAAWIQQNWPDFDLETNCAITWRGGNSPK